MKATVYAAKASAARLYNSALTKSQPTFNNIKRWMLIKWYRIRRSTVRLKTRISRFYDEKPRLFRTYAIAGLIVLLLSLYGLFKPNQIDSTEAEASHYEPEYSINENATGDIGFSPADIEERLLTLANQVADLQELVNTKVDLEPLSARIDEIKTESLYH